MALESQRSVDRKYVIELVDSSGTVCATVEKIIYIRRSESPSPKT